MKYIFAVIGILVVGAAGFFFWRRKQLGDAAAAAAAAVTPPAPATPSWSRGISSKTMRLGLDTMKSYEIFGDRQGILLTVSGTSGNTYYLPGNEVLLEGWPNITVKDTSEEAYVLNEINQMLNGTHKIIGIVGSKEGKIVGIIIDKQWENNNTLFRDAVGTVKTRGGAWSWDISTWLSKMQVF